MAHVDTVPPGRAGNIRLWFAKNAQANISAEDEALLKKAAAQALSWDDAQLDRLVACKELTEIGHEPEG